MTRNLKILATRGTVSSRQTKSRRSGPHHKRLKITVNALQRDGASDKLTGIQNSEARAQRRAQRVGTRGAPN